VAEHLLSDDPTASAPGDRPTDEAVQHALAMPLMDLLQAVAACGRTRDETFTLMRATLDRIEAEVPE
jgi:hypothetical protein